MHFLGPKLQTLFRMRKKVLQSIHHTCISVLHYRWLVLVVAQAEQGHIQGPTYNLYCVFLESVIAHKIVVEISTKISVFRPPDFKQGLKINDCLNVCQGGPLASARCCTHLVKIFTKFVFKVKICALTVIFIHQPSVGQKTLLFSKLQV